jgi:hypothetical protein
VVAASEENELSLGEVMAEERDELDVTLDRPVAPEGAFAATDLEDDAGLVGEEEVGSGFVFKLETFLRGDMVDEVWGRGVGLEVASEAEGLFNAVDLIPVVEGEVVAAEGVEFAHVGDADGLCGVEAVAEAARFGVVAAEVEDGVPRAVFF